MRPLRALLAGPVLVAGLCAAAGAQVVGEVSPRVTDLVAGLFCAPPEAGRREAPDTMSGWIHVPDEPIEMIAFGNQAPAVLGLGFGVRFTLAPGPDAQMRYSVTHPPIPPSGGTTQSWSSMLMAGTTDSAFFQFDVPAELQPGEWSFTIEADGETLFTMAFQVMKAEDLPALANLCRDGSLLSLIPATRAAAGSAHSAPAGSASSA